MKLDRLFTHLEDVEFSTYISVISGFRIVLKALEKSEILSLLIITIKNNPAQKNKVFRRLQTLLITEVNHEFQHPYDAAITGYIYVLMNVDYFLAYEIAKETLECQNLWWSRKLAQHILDTMKPSSIEVKADISHRPTVKTAAKSGVVSVGSYRPYSPQKNKRQKARIPGTRKHISVAARSKTIVLEGKVS